MTKQEFKKYIDKEVLRDFNGSKLRKRILLTKLLLIDPSALAIYYIRKMQYYADRKGKINSYKAQRYHMKLATKFGMHIAMGAKIGYGIHIPHPTGIVIGNATVIGEYCHIYQNVTIGGARVGDAAKGNQPIIEDNVTLFSGSKVLGKIRVGHDSIVAANSCLFVDSSPYSIYAGVPAVNKSQNNDHIGG